MIKVKADYIGLIWDSVRNPQCVYSLALDLPGGLAVRICLLMQETQVHYLGWKNPLKKEVATHSSILAWETPRTEEPCGL